MKATLIVLGILFMVFLSVLTFAQETKIETGTYLYEVYEKDGQSLNYRILYPQSFDESNSYPLVVFLHGSGERGSDNKAQLVHGSKLFLDSLSKYPAVVIFPQCPKADYWADLSSSTGKGSARKFTFETNTEAKPSLSLLMNLINESTDLNYIDEDRVYLSGLSMGGMGVFELLWRMPETFAAAMPICGGGAIAKASDMISTPLWIFHGAKDNVVPARFSTSMLKGIQGAGGKAKISLYPDANHNSWDAAFAEPDFLQWMFSKRRNKL